MDVGGRWLVEWCCRVVVVVLMTRVVAAAPVKAVVASAVNICRE